MRGGARAPEPKTWSGSADFPLDAFLALPLTARIATAGPTVRPVWFLWEGEAFWILTGQWSWLPRHVAKEPSVALVVDECDLNTGRVRQVIARGRGELLPFDVPRGRRKLSRYLGPDESRWDPRFVRYLHGDHERSDTRWLRVRPERLTAKDLSFRVRPGDPDPRADAPSQVIGGLTPSPPGS
ncbi:pyridoxamine 5'-phosphate oxidase family protein [Streptomyces sedi]|uniref:pyridoxamine 5'-phosphate oxidase family protein n=1 Tax=Streptomyces sedi TaxID=555059 RepID=UPI00269F82A7